MKMPCLDIHYHLNLQTSAFFPDIAIPTPACHLSASGNETFMIQFINLIQYRSIDKDQWEHRLLDAACPPRPQETRPFGMLPPTLTHEPTI
ncbi:hypothetical protein RRG08_061014 [Elysia crispata]|uniref:Uncharacterized protein n=1 Tax=Elysia crispata TaxID=231223 RepID=A0AAE1AVA2_9GAST|nr:hypothetical protein RRG08_061014 [Elysia crispata]